MYFIFVGIIYLILKVVLYYLGMFYFLEKNCLYEDWMFEVRIYCFNFEYFYCLKDDYERIVWLCVELIWVNKGIFSLFYLLICLMLYGCIN